MCVCVDGWWVGERERGRERGRKRESVCVCVCMAKPSSQTIKCHIDQHTVP